MFAIWGDRGELAAGYGSTETSAHSSLDRRLECIRRVHSLHGRQSRTADVALSDHLDDAENTPDLSYGMPTLQHRVQGAEAEEGLTFSTRNWRRGRRRRAANDAEDPIGGGEHDLPKCSLTSHLHRSDVQQKKQRAQALSAVWNVFGVVSAAQSAITKKLSGLGMAVFEHLSLTARLPESGERSQFSLAEHTSARCLIQYHRTHIPLVTR